MAPTMQIGSCMVRCKHLHLLLEHNQGIPCMHELRCKHLLPERPVHLKFGYTGIVWVLCAETRHE